MYYILDKIELLETYKKEFIGTKETVRFNLDKTKFIIEGLKPIKELKDFEYSKEQALEIVSGVEWTKKEEI